MKRLILFIAFLGLSFIAYGAYIPAKAVLAQYLINDVFDITDRNNKTASYQVNSIEIIDATKEDIAIYSDENELKLITCYPFDAIVARGPLRYVVTAKLI